MRKLIIFSLFIIGLSLSSAGKRWEVNSAPASKPLVNPNQWALLIGVGDYPGNTVDLKYPGADASSIKDLLISSAGYAEDHVIWRRASSPATRSSSSWLVTAS